VARGARGADDFAQIYGENTMKVEKKPIAYSKALSTYDFNSSKYSAQERIKVSALYLIHGNLSKVSREIDIPESTLRDWRQSDWWEQLSVEIRDEKEDEFRAGFSRIIEAAQARVEEALDQGETKMFKTKDGYEKKLVPVGAKDAVMIGAISYDKLRISQNLPTSISAGTDTKGVLAKLEELSDRLDQREASVISDQ
jgi:transposase-like protein